MQKCTYMFLEEGFNMHKYAVVKLGKICKNAYNPRSIVNLPFLDWALHTDVSKTAAQIRKYLVLTLIPWAEPYHSSVR